VMKEKKSKRDKKITIRFTGDELKKIRLGFSSSTQRKMSEYARNVLLEKPITVYTRSKTNDEFLNQMILLKNELKAIGNNFNQLVKKLHAIDHDEEIKSWAIMNENSKAIFFKKVNEINLTIEQISAKWLQE
jgi:hypothetical protein